MPGCARIQLMTCFQQDGDKEHALGIARGARCRRCCAAACRLACRAGAAMSSGSPFSPGGKAGRGDDVVERHRQPKAVLLGIEGVQVNTPSCCEGRLLDADDQLGQVQVLPRAPGVLNDVGEQDVLAAAHRVGLDPHQTQQAPTQCPGSRSRSVSLSVSQSSSGALEAAHDAHRAARPPNRACRWRTPPLPSARGCAPAPRPSSPAPRASLACAAAKSSGVRPLRRGVVRVDPGQEILGRADRGTSAAGW